MPRKPSQQEAALRAVREIYTELAQRPVVRNCTRLSECCQFKLTGRTPFLTKGEALLAWRGLRASGRKALPESTDGTCPLLKAGRCIIYEHRPFGCRTHFCKAAGGPVERSQVRDLIRRLEQIDRELGGNGAVNLPTALRAVEE